MKEGIEYDDNVYGRITIDEPVIAELISSHELQRLKEIDQAGYYDPYHPGSKHTRFEHSLGVYALLKRFNAPIEERIAGLIHDVSHSAFSHAVDYVLAEGSEKEQSHQDDYFKEYVLGSGIPDILKKHGFDVGYIIDEDNFPLLETKLPDICADRIDYSLRGMIAYGMANQEKAGEILKKLEVENNKWVFSDFASANRYAELFKDINTKYYSGITTAVMFRRIADYLKYSMSRGYIGKNDLYTTDQEVIAKISKNLANDKELAFLWKRMNSGSGYKDDPGDYDVEVYCKSRVIDPLCFDDGEMKRVSGINPDWLKVIEEEMKPKVYFIKFSD